MLPLRLTNRCELFEKIANDTWHKVIRNHRVDVHVHETGRTNDIIEEIRTSDLSTNIGVWAKNGWREVDHGSDIDVFVETKTDQFVWWALQAKVLMLNGRYDFAPPAGEVAQWIKLQRLAQRAGCISRYLLYNGVASYKHAAEDRCNREYSQEQFGCSLVETQEVQRLMLFGMRKFTDIHPDSAEPWRTITCCHKRSKVEGVTLYTLDQVRNSTEYYQAVAGNENTIEPVESAALQEPVKPVNNLPDNEIALRCEEVKRDPLHRMVIRTSSSLNQTRPL